MTRSVCYTCISKTSQNLLFLCISASVLQLLFLMGLQRPLSVPSLTPILGTRKENFLLKHIIWNLSLSKDLILLWKQNYCFWYNDTLFKIASEIEIKEKIWLWYNLSLSLSLSLWLCKLKMCGNFSDMCSIQFVKLVTVIKKDIAKHKFPQTAENKRNQTSEEK